MFIKLALSNTRRAFGYNFSNVKKVKMELTLRTPYKTFFENFDGFQRILTKTNEAALII